MQKYLHTELKYAVIARMHPGINAVVSTGYVECGFFKMFHGRELQKVECNIYIDRHDRTKQSARIDSFRTPLSLSVVLVLNIALWL